MVLTALNFKQIPKNEKDVFRRRCLLYLKMHIKFHRNVNATCEKTFFFLIL